MERRDFLTATACGLVGLGLPAAGSAQGQASGKRVSVKLTVLRRGLEKEYVDKYRGGEVTLCTKFKEGQEFTITSHWALPEGFCAWAWGDIRTYIHDVFAGQSQTVACCTDGFRPVFFKIERIEG